MKVADIARGMITGYGLRLLQMVASLIVVPFLLRDDVLGIDNYGRIFSILGALSFVSLLTDGMKASFARSIAQSMSHEDISTGRRIGSAVKLMTTICVVLGVVLLTGHVWLLELLSIPVEADYRMGAALAICAVVFENLLFIFSSLLTARGRMDVLNAILGVEVIVRNGAFLVWFSIADASLTGYFTIFFAGIAARLIVLVAFSLSTWPRDFEGFWSSKIADSADAVRYSFSLSMVSVNYFIFQRLSIPLTARFIGPAEAGLLAIALGTIANNLSQVLFNVARPLLVPVASRIDFGSISASRSRLLLGIDGAYSLLVVLVTVSIIASMPTLIGLWLGVERLDLVLPAQILVAGACVQVGFNVRRAFLVGQGRARMLARVSIACGAVGLFGLAWALGVSSQWLSVAVVVAAVSGAASAIGAGLGFDASGLLPESARSRRGWRILGTMAVGIAAGFWSSRWAPTGISPMAVVPPLVTLTVAMAASQWLLIGVGEVREVFVRLRAGADRSVVNDAGAGSD